MKNLALKLLAFQKEVGAIPKNEENPFFKSKYADINTYIEVVKPILSAHGLVILQPLSTAYTNGSEIPHASLKTILVDSESGEQVEDTVVLPNNPDPQKMGAIITYFRRYAIQSMLCLQAEDTDGNDTAPKALVGAFNKVVEPSVEEQAEAFFNDVPFPSKPPAYTTKVVGSKCPDCAEGRYVSNPKTGKIFCDKKCWLQKA